MARTVIQIAADPRFSLEDDAALERIPPRCVRTCARRACRATTNAAWRAANSVYDDRTDRLRSTEGLFEERDDRRIELLVKRVAVEPGGAAANVGSRLGERVAARGQEIEMPRIRNDDVVVRPPQRLMHRFR
jgi:hypothetical protein